MFPTTSLHSAVILTSVKFQISYPDQQFFDGLDTAGGASDSLDTTVKCLCEVVLSDGKTPPRKKMSGS